MLLDVVVPLLEVGGCCSGTVGCWWIIVGCCWMLHSPTVGG